MTTFNPCYSNRTVAEWTRITIEDYQVEAAMKRLEADLLEEHIKTVLKPRLERALLAEQGQETLGGAE